MGLLFNEYSFLILAIALTVMAGFVLLTRNPKWNDFLAFVVITAGVITTWVVLHPSQTPLMGDAKVVKEMIGSGTPVLLEFQSPFCISCTAIKPVVDSLEQELGPKIHVIRLNVQESVGQELGAVYGFEFTPTFIFFDAQGNESWRQVGALDSQKVRDSIK